MSTAPLDLSTPPVNHAPAPALRTVLSPAVTAPAVPEASDRCSASRAAPPQTPPGRGAAGQTASPGSRSPASSAGASASSHLREKAAGRGYAASGADGAGNAGQSQDESSSGERSGPCTGSLATGPPPFWGRGLFAEMRHETFLLHPASPAHAHRYAWERPRDTYHPRCQRGQSVYSVKPPPAQCKTLALPSSTFKQWSQQHQGLGCSGDLTPLQH